MPLVMCSDCGHLISERATFCVSCGAPTTEHKSVPKVAAPLEAKGTYFDSARPVATSQKYKRNQSDHLEKSLDDELYGQGDQQLQKLFKSPLALHRLAIRLLARVPIVKESRIPTGIWAGIIYTVIALFAVAHFFSAAPTETTTTQGDQQAAQAPASASTGLNPEVSKGSKPFKGIQQVMQETDKQFAERGKNDLNDMNAVASRGYYLTNPGFIGASSEKLFDEASDYVTQNDEDALAELMSTGGVFPLQGGLKVNIVRYKGFMGDRVELRVRGQRGHIWTVREAIL